MHLDRGGTLRLLIGLLGLLVAGTAAHAQSMPYGRLPADLFDAMAPSARVSGTPGKMVARQATCRTVEATGVRRRIVDVAVQEWAFFGFPIVDRMAGDVDDEEPDARPRRRRLSPEESARVADSIAGYWTATPEGAWILNRQNEAWNGADGIAARWRYPWSAAFVSWVMCEGGLGSAGRFQRAVAHHTYIDQAIRARTASSSPAAFVAYDVGEAAVEPGDLLCSARRPAYRTIAERRRQLGVGARTHCDVVVKVDPAGRRILAIGGNVGGSVSLKVLPATTERGVIRPMIVSLGERGVSLFAHLKLRAASIGPDALDRSPTLRAMGCGMGFRPPTQLTAANLLPAAVASPQRCIA